MFLDVVSTHTKYIINDFALAPRTDLLNFKCHTVKNGTELRKSPSNITFFTNSSWVLFRTYIVHPLLDLKSF